MSGSALFTSGIAVPPTPSAFTGSRYGAVAMKPATRTGGGGGLVIECSSRPKKKATAHHKKTRPRKTQPWDIKRKPTVYAPLPPMPPEWTLVTGEDFPQTPTATQTLESESEQ